MAAARGLKEVIFILRRVISVITEENSMHTFSHAIGKIIGSQRHLMSSLCSVSEHQNTSQSATLATSPSPVQSSSSLVPTISHELLKYYTLFYFH